MELTLDAYRWPPLLHPPRRVGPRRDPPPREDLIALSALAVEDAGRRLNPRCRGGSPGQVDPDSKPPWWRLANLRHPRVTPRAHLHRRCCSVPPLQRSSMAGSAAPRREPCRVPSSPAPRHRSQQAAPPSLCASPSWRTGSSRIRPLRREVAAAVIRRSRTTSPAGSAPPQPGLTATPPTCPLSPYHTCVQVLKRREKG